MSINKRRLNNLNTDNLTINHPGMNFFEEIDSGFPPQKLPQRLRIVPKQFIVEEVKHKLNLPVSVYLRQVELNSKIFTRLWLSFPITAI